MDFAHRSASIIPWQELGAELVFSQDAEGKFLGFYWEAAPEYGFLSEGVVGQSMEQIMTPIAKEAYYERLRRVLARGIPEQCHCCFAHEGRSLPFELVISPIVTKQGSAQAVLVMGHHLRDQELYLTNNSALPFHPDPYQKLQRSIASKILVPHQKHNLT